MFIEYKDFLTGRLDILWSYLMEYVESYKICVAVFAECKKNS